MSCPRSPVTPLNSNTMRGFTLVEILIALAIVATIMAMLGGILVDVLNRKSEVEKAMETQQIGPAILRLITRDLEALFVYQLDKLKDSTSDNSGANSAGSAASNNSTSAGLTTNTVNYFIGKSSGEGMNSRDSLHFVTSVDSKLRIGSKQSDVTEVGYFLVENRDDKIPGRFTLYRREDFHIDKNPIAGGKSIKVFDRVLGLMFRYFKQPESESDQEALVNGTADGDRSWDNTEKGALPWAVEITVWIDLRTRPGKTDLAPNEVRRYRTTVRLPPYPSKKELERLADDAATDNSGDNTPRPGSGGGGR